MSSLAGRRVVVTRSREQATALCETLISHGAEPVLFPTIAFERVDADLEPLSSYHWVVFTSVNGVRFFLEQLDSTLLGAWPADLKIAAVGPVTRAALEERGISIHAMPDEFRATALVGALGDLNGSRVLLPRADIGGRELVSALERAGAIVHDVAVYRTVPAEPDAASLAALRRGVDVVTFTSPSTVRNFLALLGDEGRALLAGAVVAAIGVVTAEAAREEGIRVDVQPDAYTTDALVEALEDRLEVRA